MGSLMTSDQMNTDRILEEHGKRLTIHAERLGKHDEILNEHQKMLAQYGLSLYGDEQLDIPGLIDSMRDMSVALKGLLNWRAEMVIYYRAARMAVRLALILLSIIGGGVWWPQIAKLLDLLGG